LVSSARFRVRSATTPAENTVRGPPILLDGAFGRQHDAPMPATSLPVEHLFNITAYTTVNATVAGPSGTRVIIDASSGTFDGPRLKGTVKGPGGDWVTVRANGMLGLDVRLLLETDDGAAIYMTYQGVAKAAADWIRSAPTFETGDERYAWLNDIQAIATGVAGEGSVTYEVYQVL